VSSALFFKYNTQLGPPYQVLVDTNFINFSIKNKVRRPGQPARRPARWAARRTQRPASPFTPDHPTRSHPSPPLPPTPTPKIDLVRGMMDCLYAECTPMITDCVMAELEKLGQKYRVALKVAKVRARGGHGPWAPSSASTG
jgi:U3 small nucleolar RNA-associated protein 24